MATEVESRARLLFEAAERAGWRNPAAIVERVRGLQRGLPAEDELAVILHWLGRCRVIHKLDQASQYPPSSKGGIVVPDLLAIFEHGGHLRPVLLEVKQTKKGRLKWRQDYLDGLRAYSSAVGIPLLIAWKHATFWCLFDPSHFCLAKTNVHVSFLDVMPHSVMSSLAGDFSFSLQPGVGFHLHMRKEQKTGNGWQVQIKRAYVTDGDGRQYGNAPGVLPLLACFPNEAELKETPRYLHQSYVVVADNAAEFAHRCLVQLIAAFGGREKPKSWRGYLQGARLPELAANFYDTVDKLGPAFVRRIYRIRPKIKPTFLQPRANFTLKLVRPGFGPAA